MDRSGWIDAKTHRRDGACSASVSSDSSAGEVLVLISIAQTSPSQPARRTGAIVDYAADQGGFERRTP